MSETIVHTDQIGREVEIPKEPQRIISLVPSQTELLFDLGLDKRVVGITKFCIHPEEWFRTKTRIGGTKQLHVDTIESLRPDLIIANKEENNRGDIEGLEQKYPVWVSDVNNLESALEMIGQIGKITGAKANRLTEEVKFGFSNLTSSKKPLKALYLIWKKPYMAAGPDTFISDMLTRGGFKNVVTEARYPELSETDIANLNPEVILLSSEPFPFGPTHMKDLQHLLPNAKIELVDGEMFSWYGSRLKLVPSYLNKVFANLTSS